MTPRLPHAAFRSDYNGIVRELITPSWVAISDPIWAVQNPGRSRTRDSDFREVLAVWDTGATDSVISYELVDLLGLEPTGRIKVHDLNSIVECHQYDIGLFLPNNVFFPNLTVTEGNVTTQENLHIVIGMDVISIGDLNISNYGGKTSFSFSFPPHANRVCLLDRANKLNKRR